MSYIIKHNVPILDEHNVKDKDGRTMRVDEAYLRKVAENNNHRIKATGDYVPIVIGHTKDEADEKDQPEVVGFAGPFYVADLFNTGRKAIFARKWRIFRSKAKKASDYPRRSVELWPGLKEIDPISLLGATTPERDLGLLRYSRQDKHLSYSRISPEEPVAEDKKETGDKADPIVEKVIAALKQTDVWKFVESAMEQGGGPSPEGEEAGPEHQEPDIHDLPEDEFNDMEGGHDEFDDEPEHEDEVPEQDKEPVRYDAAAPSGTNVSPVGLADVKKKRMQRSTSEKQRYEREKAELLVANHDLRIQLQRERRRGDIQRLADEGFDIDVDEELDEIKGLSDDVYAKRLDKIKKRYNRRLPGVDEALTQETRQVRYQRNGDASRSADDAQRVIDFATKNGLTYAEALGKLQGERTF